MYSCPPKNQPYENSAKLRRVPKFVPRQARDSRLVDADARA